VQKGDG